MSDPTSNLPYFFRTSIKLFTKIENLSLKLVFHCVQSKSMKICSEGAIELFVVVYT